MKLNEEKTDLVFLFVELQLTHRKRPACHCTIQQPHVFGSLQFSIRFLFLVSLDHHSGSTLNRTYKGFRHLLINIEVRSLSSN